MDNLQGLNEINSVHNSTSIHTKPEKRKKIKKKRISFIDLGFMSKMIGYYFKIVKVNIFKHILYKA